MNIIHNDLVERLLDPVTAARKLREGFSAPEVAYANGPRQRLMTAGAKLFVMPAIWESGGVFGVKVYFPARPNIGGHTMLYDCDGALIGVIESDMLGRIRTSAVSLMAADLMAPHPIETLAVIGTGLQARAQIEALHLGRQPRSIRIFGRDLSKAAITADWLKQRLGREIEIAGTARDCIRCADLVVCATKSASPVLQHEWLAPNTLVIAMGANAANRRELDAATVREASLLVTEDREQAKAEAAEFRDAVAAGFLNWAAVEELTALARGPRQASPYGIRVFKSLGVGLADIILAKAVLDAKAALD